jgi:rubrerythrin
MNPDGVVEKALRVAMRVEEREFAEIYPHFRDQAEQAGNPDEAAVYQRVIDSERQHFGWFRDALEEYFPAAATATA